MCVAQKVVNGRLDRRSLIKKLLYSSLFLAIEVFIVVPLISLCNYCN